MAEISMADFMKARRDDTVIVDVREDDEYTEAHIPGVVHIPLGELAESTDDIPVPDDAPVYVVCRSGKRSLQGQQILEAAGIRALSVQDGTMGWIEAGGPVSSGDQP